MATPEELQARLAEIAAKREALRTAREKPLERQVAEAEAMLAAETEHGDGIVVHTFDEGIVIAKRPSALRYRQYQARVTKLATRDSEGANAELIDEAHKFVVAHLVYPTAEKFAPIADRFPGLAGDVAGKLADLAAGRARGTAVK